MQASRSDAALGLAFAALAVGGVVAIRRFIGPLGDEATIMPLIGVGGLFVASLLLAGRALLGFPGAATAAADDPAEEPIVLGRAGLARLVLAGVVIVALAWLLPLLGILATGVVLQILLYLLIGIGPLRAVLIAVVVAAVLYAGIDLLLGVPLPGGALW